MKVSKIIGIERNGVIISENNFEQFGILNTGSAISEYFDKYGYEFVEPYDLSQNLIIVQDKNLEVSLFLGMFYKSFSIINYKTCEVLSSRVMSDGLSKRTQQILGFGYRIVLMDNRARLIRQRDNSIVLEADHISFIDVNKILFRRCNIDYIMDLDTYEIFPLVKQEAKIYHGPNADNMVDFRKGMYYQNQKSIFPVDISGINIYYLIDKFPYGEKKGRLFELLSNPIKYGLSYEDTKETHEMWYDTEEERNWIYTNIEQQVSNVIAQEKQKKLKQESN